ncbi:MAG TPA: hypothetical protein VF761_00230 [Gemmatimonadaceae bacterium]
MTSREEGADARALERWLASRTDAAPPSLRPRLSAAIEASPESGDGSIADRSCLAGESLLVRLLAEGCASRTAAPDLLAADALVTYAFEAAAEMETETSASIDRRAAAAMSRIARLGARERA